MVALKVLDSLYNYGGDPFEEHWDIEDVSEEEAMDRNRILAEEGEIQFREEFQDATRKLEKLERERKQ